MEITILVILFYVLTTISVDAFASRRGHPFPYLSSFAFPHFLTSVTLTFAPSSEDSCNVEIVYVHQNSCYIQIPYLEYR